MPAHLLANIARHADERGIAHEADAVHMVIARNLHVHLDRELLARQQSGERLVAHFTGIWRLPNYLEKMLYSARKLVLAFAAPLLLVLAPVFAPRNLTWVSISLGAAAINMFNAVGNVQRDAESAHNGSALLMPIFASLAALTFYACHLWSGPGRFVLLQWMMSFSWFACGVALIVLSTAHDKEFNAFAATIYICTALNVAPLGCDMEDLDTAQKSLLASTRLAARVACVRASDASGWLAHLHLPRKDAPVLVLLHDWQWGAAAWLPCMETLGEHFDVYAVDMRGCGLSDRARRPGAMMDDLAEWRQETIGERAYVLVGWGLGGVVAAQYYSEVQDKQIRRIVLVSADGIDDDAKAELDKVRFLAWTLGVNVLGSPDMLLRAAGPLGAWVANELLLQRVSHVREVQTADDESAGLHEDVPMQMQHSTHLRQRQRHRYLQSLHRDRLSMWSDYWYCNLYIDGAGGLRLGTHAIGEAAQLVQYVAHEAGRRSVNVVSLEGSPLDDPAALAREIVEVVNN